MVAHRSPTISPGYVPRQVFIRVLVLVVPLLALLAGLTGFLYMHDRQQEDLLHGQAVRHLLTLQTEIVNRESRTIESDLRYLADQSLLKDYLAGSDSARELLEQEYVRFCGHRRIYDQIRIVDVRGQERIRVNYERGRPRAVSEAELQSKADRYYFLETIQLERGQVFFSPVDLNIEHGQIEQPHKPVLRLACPVYDREDNKRGILILNFLAAELLNKLAAAAESAPGEAWVLNERGYYLHGPRNEEWAFMYGRAATFPTRFREVWPVMSREGRGEFWLPEGLLAFHALTPRRAVRPSASPFKSESYSEPAGKAVLLLVAFVPSERLRARSSELLTRLLFLCGGAALVLTVLAFYLAYASTLRRLHEIRLAESEARLRALSTRLLSAQEDERRRIARDLHDELGQIMTALRLNLDRVDAAGSDDKRRSALESARQAASCLIDRMHELTAQIRPLMLDDLGLKDTVRNYLGEFERKFGIALRTDLDFQRHDVPPAVAENAYRILQEALTNVCKHAGTREAWVQLRVDGARLTLSVRDQGCGFRAGAVPANRLGLLGMRERAELLGGEFTLKTEAGGGTEICVTLPLNGNV